MAVNFSAQFRINEKTQSRVLRLTDTSTGFTLAKGNFSVTFPDGSTRIKTDFSSPDIAAAGGFVDITLVTDSTGAVIAGNYKIDFVALDTSLNGYNLSRTTNFNWVKPTKNIVDGSDVLLPEVKFFDNTSYLTIGSFSGTLTRTFTTVMPSNTPQSGTTVTGTGNLINPVFSGNYYEGIYTARADVSVAYTHSTDAWASVLYIDLLQQVIDVQRAPTQYQLIGFINTYHAAIEAYETTNDTQFDILNEEYDLVMALYSHLIARYESTTLDGSEPILAQLLDILRPYNTHTYTSAPLAAFALETKSFNISDGTNTDLVPLNSTLNILGSNGIVTAVTNNTVTTSPTYGTTSGTIAQGNDSRFHNPVTIGTSNGLSLSTQVLSLSSATTSAAGAMSAADKTKLDGIAAGAQIGTVTSVGVSMPAAFTVSNSPVTTSGTIAITATGTTLQYMRGDGTVATLNTTVVTEGDNLYYTQGRFDTALAAKSTTNLAEGTNLYFTNLRARQAISLTTSGTSGAATYDSATGVLNIPAYQGGVTSFNTRTGAITLTSGDVTTALGYTPESTLNKGIAGGYASLDGGGLVPSTQLPSYVDDVLEFANLAALPATGETGKIYVALDTNKIYRWSGSAYIEVSPTVGTIWGGITGTLANQTDLQNALNAKQNTLTLTTTGTSGAATLVGATLNIPEYQGGVTSFNTRTGAITLSSGDVTTALGFTPYNATNPSNYIALTALSSTATGLTYTNTTGVFSLTTGYAIPTTVKQGNWDDAYTFVAAFPSQTGNTGKYLTTDGSVLSWGTVVSGVTSFNTRTGAITLTSGDVTTALTYTPYPTPTGDTTQYIAGDGSLVAFPVAGQSGTLVRQVRNETGATLTKGTVVYISGATGNKPTVSKAIATGDSTSAQTFGLVQADISNNSNGYVVCVGDIAGLNTSAFAEGVQLYLSATTAGTYTSTKQYAPNHLVYVGVVTRSHPTQGEIEVKIQNGYELDELHDVAAQTPSNNDGLFYESSTNLWKNKTIATVLGFTPANDGEVVKIAGTQTITGIKVFNDFRLQLAAAGTSQPTVFQNSSSVSSGSGGYNTLGFNQDSNLFFNDGTAGNVAVLSFSNTTARTYTLPDASGTLALTSALSSYVPTSRTITINGTTFDLSADRTYTITPSASARAEQSFTATAGQTTFTITGGYVVGLVDVFINGARLLPTDYTATNGTTVVLGTGALLNDAVTVLNYTSTIAALPTSRDVIDYTATAAQTTFTVSGGYTVGLLDVYVNGSKLTAAEFTATNGTTFVLTEASVVGNQVQAIRYNASVTGISGSGTANYVPKFTASQTVGNSLIFDNGTHIGIGTATPNLGVFGRALTFVAGTGYAGVEIYGASATGGAQLDFGGSTTRFAAISGEYESSTNGYLNIRTLRAGSITDAVRITSAGNVGIGTTSPDIYGFGSSGKYLTLQSVSGGFSLIQVISDSTSGAGIVFGNTTLRRASIEGTNGSNLVFSTNASNSGTSNTERMRITSAGNVGIGTTTPLNKFTVVGVSSFQLSDANDIRLIINPTASGINISGTYNVNGSYQPITISTSDTERMRIFASGNVRFSSQVYGNTVASPRTLFIASDGELGGISSVRESKTNINAINSNWLMQLNPVSFNYRKKDNDGIYTNEYFNELFYGLIAEETELINKEICTYTDGKLVGIEYSKLVPVLVKAIQELSAKITILENK
jgi:hypothetical protein